MERIVSVVGLGHAENDPVAGIRDICTVLLAGRIYHQDDMGLEVGLQIRSGKADQRGNTQVAWVDEETVIKRRGVDSELLFTVLAGNLDGEGFFQKKTAPICKGYPLHPVTSLRNKGKRLSLYDRHPLGNTGRGADQDSGEKAKRGCQKEQPCRQETDALPGGKGRACQAGTVTETLQTLLKCGKRESPG